jgi:polyphosphate kinase 2 (PPK2 family)
MIICLIMKKQLINIYRICTWYVIPGDDKEMSRYIVAKIIWEEMQNIPISSCRN